MELHNNFHKDSRLNFIVKKDPRDHRDLFCKVADSNNIKNKVDLREWCSPIEEQLHLGSCVGQAIVGAIELILNKNYPLQFIDLSRLFVYYNARVIEGNFDQDSGTYVRNGIKSINKWGVCSEDYWPYLTDKVTTMPNIESYIDAKRRLINNYYRITSIEDMILTINTNNPIVAGIEVFGDFDNIGINSNPVLQMPADREESLGGHAITIVGYDNNKQYFICRNSYGEQWGDRGYFYMPYEYAELYALDSWTFDIKLDINHQVLI